MAALPDDSYGIDPATMEEGIPLDGGQLPPELLEQLGGDPGVDPNSPPADPMLQQEPVDPYQGLGEFETRERVELCVLLAIETCAKAVEAGEGASNPEYAMKYAQASASLGQTYQSLTLAEQKDPAAPPVDPAI